MRRRTVVGFALTAAMLCGCVTEEIPPPAIHTSAYVTSQPDDAPEDAGPIVNPSPADTAASAKVSAETAPAAAPSAATPLPLSSSALPPPPGR